VGEVAATLPGAVYATNALEIVHSRAVENMPAILAALKELDARYRYRSELRPNESHVTTRGHRLLQTNLGWIDFLGRIGPGWDYNDLLPHSTEMDIDPGFAIRVLDLETIIASKEVAGGEKDLLVLPLLRRTLQEVRRLEAAKAPPPGTAGSSGSGRLAYKHHRPVRLTVLSPRC
jgi:hypothetical protein